MNQLYGLAPQFIFYLQIKEEEGEPQHCACTELECSAGQQVSLEFLKPGKGFINDVTKYFD